MQPKRLCAVHSNVDLPDVLGVMPSDAKPHRTPKELRSKSTGDLLCFAQAWRPRVAFSSAPVTANSL